MISLFAFDELFELMLNLFYETKMRSKYYQPKRIGIVQEESRKMSRVNRQFHPVNLGLTSP